MENNERPSDVPEAMNRQAEQVPTPEGRVGRGTASLRRSRGWSQTELADQMAARGFDMHQTTVAKLENGLRPIRLNEVAALADIFDVEMADLTAGSTVYGASEHDQAVRAAKHAWTRAATHAAILRGQLAEAEAEAEDAKARYRALVEEGEHGGRTAKG